ncbi:ABC transporter ATP-binding protein [Eubacterium multiforme]|uniref:Teichoic acid transport system ATP-binding protein n=1 Tax=Eubacterium multiforme TaxID=83339 RepID=A0ABT9UXE9_9FIRM|nr:ABC transporter ATP-binding protein [Eubacterium multiforme]MDQ0150971.1 teichoic acid transport system ATP-binding protein [Eubacterium multiforme]
MYAIKINNISKTYRIYQKPFKRVVDLIFNKKHYTEYNALDKINVEIPKGEAVGVLGKNGAGKSTLLKIITGVVKPTSGNVDIKGKISAILELNSGFDQELTGYENVYVKGAILGYKKEEMDKKIDEIIAFADIGDYINQPVRTYSSGMKARLGFAISVNVDPDVLIVDEALSVGDDIFKTKCLRRMSEFRKQGKTIFFVSHSLYTVGSFCTKCMWIKDGKLVDYGPTKEVMTKYENFLKEEKAKDKKKKKAEGKNEKSKKDYIEVKNFKFENNGKFNFGEDIVYSFDYEVKEKMDNLKWSFTIRDASTNLIYSSDKMDEEYLIKNDIGKHRIELKVKNVLLPGKYLLSGELREGTGIFFVGYSNKREFSVEYSDKKKGNGVVFIEHEVLNNN